MIKSNDWLCLRTSAGQEQRLVTALNQLQIPAYTPRFQRKVTRFFHQVTTDFALFKTYLFASPEQYHERKAAIQLLPVRMRSYVIGELPATYLDEMREREDRDGYIVLSKQESKAAKQGKFQAGDRLVYSGLSDFEAVFDSYTSDDQRVIILATMFNQQQRIPVDLSNIAFA